jgi:hypothetical protein
MPRGKAKKTLLLIDRCALLLQEMQPATVRAVCYQLFVHGWLPSMEKNHTDKVSKHLVYAREQGIIPWPWIVDETREAEHVPAWTNPLAYCQTIEHAYRRDHWAQQPYRVEVWSEKSTVQGILRPVLRQYGVPCRYMHGYASATAVHEAAVESQADPRAWIVFYVGDWDPSGLHMSAVDIPERLAAYGGETIALNRVALTAEDIADPNLPSFPADSKAKDARFRWFIANYGRQCWELDAMNPVTLRQRMEQAIRSVIDWQAWGRCTRAEEAEKATIRTVLGNWRHCIVGQASQ